MTVRINKQKINLREKLAEFEGKVNSLEAYNTVLENLPYESSGLSVGGPIVGQIKTSDGVTSEGLSEEIGKNWTKVEMGSSLEYIISLVYCGNGIVLAGSGSSAGDGDIYRSVDYGQTFTKIEMGSSLEAIRALVYCGNGIVLAGAGNSADDGDIYRSTLLEEPNYFAGNVGIGTSNPNVALDVSGSIEYTGTITDVSDQRKKENIQALENSLSKICQLNGKSYEMIEDNQGEKETELGFIAQEVQQVFPEIVKVVESQESEDGETQEYLGVSYIQLIAPLVESIKEQQSIIEDLKSRIETLESK